MKTKIICIVLLFSKTVLYGQYSNDNDYYQRSPFEENNYPGESSDFENFGNKEIEAYDFNYPITEDINKSTPYKITTDYGDWGNIPEGEPIQAPIEDCYPVLLVLVGIYFLYILKKHSLSYKENNKE